MKFTGRIRNFVSWRFMGSVGLLLVLMGTACQKEAEFPEYRNVARELALDGLEKAVRESGTVIAGPAKTSLTERRDAVQKALRPALSESKKLLFTYGISEDYLKKEFKDLNDPRILLAGVWLLSAERKDSQARSIHRAHMFGLGFLAQENSLTESQPDWMECMLIAVGVDAIVEFVKGNITETLAKKAIRKIASRTLGWVGVALALYEYGNCMGWY